MDFVLAEDDAPKRSEIVAAQIRARIASGELVAGNPLPSETVLLEQHTVARPTMREALRILESEGLLTVKRGKGGGPRIAVPHIGGLAKQAAFLLQVSGTTLADVLRARRVIEAPTMEDITALTKPPVLAALEANLSAAAELINDDVAIVARGTAIHDEFHRIIVRAAGGDTLSLFHTTINAIIDKSSRSFVAKQPSARSRRMAYRSTVQAHREVLDALRENKGPKAVASWTEHVNLVERAMVRAWGNRQTVVDLFSPAESTDA